MADMSIDQRYRISGQTLRRALAKKNITSLHHATTVLTARTFIARRGLLSRGALERSGMPFTPQRSDSIDLKYGLWDDIFLDAVDLHQLGRRNYYGPVVFVFDAPSLLARIDTGTKAVTALNPQGKYATDQWQGTTRTQRWIPAAHLAERLQKKTYKQSMVFHAPDGVLPFEDSLQRIILDDPGLDFRNDTRYGFARRAIGKSLAEAGLNVAVERRFCRTGDCDCRSQYARSADLTRRMFRTTPPRPPA